MISGMTGSKSQASPQAIAEIRREHENIAQVLNLLDAQISIFETGDRPDYDLIQDIVEYFVTFPDLYHHPKENLIYRRMRDRDPEFDPDHGDLEGEHEKISDRLQGFSKAMVNVMLEVEVPRDAFIALARTFIEGERDHMAAEEKYFLPVAEETLHEADWAEIDEILERFGDPLDDSDFRNRFTVLFDHLKQS